MRVPTSLVDAMGAPFEELISRFAKEIGLLPETESLSSERYLSRSVVPHIRKLSQLFNRLNERPTPGKKDAERGLGPYWKASSNPAHLRLAYFLYFMPSNLFRVASIWSELVRLGYRWPSDRSLSALEIGAGPASGACGIGIAEAMTPAGLPSTGTWALIEQDKAMLELGKSWAETCFQEWKHPEWGVRPFHKKVDIEAGLLPPRAPRFDLWVMSYFLNELKCPPEETARMLLSQWEKHLADEGIAIIVEPALRVESRRLLEIRKALIEQTSQARFANFQILLPCLGHQACGALAGEDDWCHEEVSWWRPPYFRILDRLAELDRKSLPFSYLVVTKSKRSRQEILPALGSLTSSRNYRLVSPSHPEGREQEFFLCGQEGKLRARYRAESPEDPAAELERGDILLDAEIRGDARSSRVSRISKRV